MWTFHVPPFFVKFSLIFVICVCDEIKEVTLGGYNIIMWLCKAVNPNGEQNGNIFQQPKVVGLLDKTHQNNFVWFGGKDYCKFSVAFKWRMIFQAIGKQIAHHHYCSVWQFTVFETRLKLKQSSSNWRRVHILYVNLFVPIRLHYGLPTQYIFMLIAFKWKHLKKIALRKWERTKYIFLTPTCTLYIATNPLRDRHDQSTVQSI